MSLGVISGKRFSIPSSMGKWSTYYLLSGNLKLPLSLHHQFWWQQLIPFRDYVMWWKWDRVLYGVEPREDCGPPRTTKYLKFEIWRRRANRKKRVRWHLKSNLPRPRNPEKYSELVPTSAFHYQVVIRYWDIFRGLSSHITPVEIEVLAKHNSSF